MLSTISLLAFALASFQSVAALPQAESSNIGSQNTRLAINGVIQDTKEVNGRAMSNSPFSAWLWNDHCTGGPDFTWQAGADGECFTFVDGNGNHRDMYSVKVDTAHCTSFVYHDNYNCKGNNFHGPGGGDGCNSYTINRAGVPSTVTSIKSFQIRCA